MNCIVCQCNLGKVKPGGRMPLKDATEFVGGGNYGSRVTDDDGQYFINVCDTCIQRALEIGTCFRRIRRD